MQELTQKMKQWQLSVEVALDRFFSEDNQAWNLINQAGRYSLLAGGKRLRPILVPALAEAIEGGSLRAGEDYVKPAEESLLLLAAAIEMIHTYSLVHDDLPAMDNDDLRRGRPTNHVVYGEAVAILAGDALLNRAYELLFELALVEDKRGARAGLEVARLAGKDGMIGGQVLDITWPVVQADRANKVETEITMQPAETHLKLLQSLKTGALLRAPLTGTASLYGLTEPLQTDLNHFGDLLGRAFQIQDDLLDVDADEADLGKSTGKDARDSKLTYVTLLGKETARQRLAQVTTDLNQALDQLEKEGLSLGFFRDLVVYLNERNF